MSKPNFNHDCKCCVSLGDIVAGGKTADLYFCRGAGPSPTVIARYSDEPSDYASGMAFTNVENGSAELIVARIRAEARGLCGKSVPVKMADLKIGDVVKLLPLTHEPFNELTVVNVDKEKGTVKFFSHYTSLGDFLYTGGVIAYIGLSGFETPVMSHEYMLIKNIFTEKKLG